MAESHLLINQRRMCTRSGRCSQTPEETYDDSELSLNLCKPKTRRGKTRTNVAKIRQLYSGSPLSSAGGTFVGFPDGMLRPLMVTTTHTQPEPIVRPPFMRGMRAPKRQINQRILHYGSQRSCSPRYLGRGLEKFNSHISSFRQHDKAIGMIKSDPASLFNTVGTNMPINFSEITGKFNPMYKNCSQGDCFQQQCFPGYSGSTPLNNQYNGDNLHFEPRQFPTQNFQDHQQFTDHISGDGSRQIFSGNYQLPQVYPSHYKTSRIIDETQFKSWVEKEMMDECNNALGTQNKETDNLEQSGCSVEQSSTRKLGDERAEAVSEALIISVLGNSAFFDSKDCQLYKDIRAELDSLVSSTVNELDKIKEKQIFYEKRNAWSVRSQSQSIPLNYTAALPHEKFSCVRQAYLPNRRGIPDFNSREVLSEDEDTDDVSENENEAYSSRLHIANKPVIWVKVDPWSGQSGDNPVNPLHLGHFWRT